jgi:hypothetical protein
MSVRLPRRLQHRNLGAAHTAMMTAAGIALTVAGYRPLALPMACEAPSNRQAIR